MARGLSACLAALGVAAVCLEKQTVAVAEVSAWVGDAPGNWNDPARWTGLVPGAMGTTAVLGASSVPRTIAVGPEVYRSRVDQLVFDSDSPYQLGLSGSSSVTYLIGPVDPGDEDTSAPIRISVLRGSHAIGSTVAGSSLADVRIARGAFLSIERVQGEHLDVAGGGELRTDGIVGTVEITVQRLTTLTARDTAEAPALGSHAWFGDSPSLNVSGIVRISSAGLPDRPKLAAVLDGAGGSGKLVLQSDQLPGNRPVGIAFTTVPRQHFAIDLGRGLATFSASSDNADLLWRMVEGRNGGTWDGLGIGSSLAGGGGVTGAESLALVPAEVLEPWHDALTDYWLNSAVVYTYLGDTNVDGIVDDVDLANLEFGLSLGQIGSPWDWPLQYGGWRYGDFNYDGRIDADDVALFEFGRRAQGVPLGMAALVPEVGSGVAVGTGLVCAMTRRRRSADKVVR